MTDNAKNYHEKMFPGYVSDFLRTDPEFIEAFDNFAFDEVVNQDDLDDKTRFISILAVLLGYQGIDEFKGMLKAAYNFGVTPVEMKEIVYQAVAYLGIGRVFPFLKAVNSFIEETLGLKLPLENQNDPNTNRLEKGEQAQVAIFGEEMRGYATSGDPKTVHIRKWLTDNCFGDYYTRSGLDYKQREMITFCFLYAQGGCKPQAIAHAKANIRLGNDEAFLIKVVSQNVPFVGYPRSLNAIDCIEKAGKE
ncbi:carboxymuconolactone decarboxylase family protein [Faecalibacillus intestinalis]|jgi:4-carboxymuconolactone decarboxylase|uniref:carboxymuconolactone decarboxylase family protein n=1 Tax=Faecalibacillus intestinalis TaxID=1982626 RepID=UPI0013850368|nr:carboxymuconolactone decarboxylase family protein [Faecalibacillus intestinalis]MEE1446596.1 carboxymuconolactone decarboxylase family protein [Faecalibacillus intestinalis]MZK54605.1 carboxymuconolactone decarboxylase [Coprobacillus sp. BIOML-A1]